MRTGRGVSMLPGADRYVLDHAKIGTIAMGVSLWLSDYRLQVWWQESAYQADALCGIAETTDLVMREYGTGRRAYTLVSIRPVLREARRVCSIASQVSSSTYLEGHLADTSHQCVPQYLHCGRSIAGLRFQVDAPEGVSVLLEGLPGGGGCRVYRRTSGMRRRGTRSGVCYE